MPADGVAPGPVHLRRTEENVREIAALAELLGGAAGLEGLLGDLRYRARRSVLPRILGRAVRRGWAFDSHDQRDRRWWPQGISTSADASDDEVVARAEGGEGRRVVVVTWYSHEVDGANHGSRVTFLDLDTLRYRHVLLVDPVLTEEGLRLEPLHIHAGGIVWWGPWLHIAATGRGFVTCRVDDIMRVAGDDERPDEFGVLADGRVASYGHHYVLPVRARYTAHAEDPKDRLRYSFLSLDRTATPPELVAGEYGRGGQSTRLARYELDPDSQTLRAGEDGWSWPLALEAGGVNQMQGSVVTRGVWHTSVSQGPWMPGSMYVGSPGRLRRHRWALPMGPEDLSYWPSTDTLWTVTEHPRRRWICAVPRGWFDRR